MLGLMDGCRDGRAAAAIVGLPLGVDGVFLLWGVLVLVLSPLGSGVVGFVVGFGITRRLNFAFTSIPD